MTTEEIYKLPVDYIDPTDPGGWRVLPNGKRVRLGKGVELGEEAHLGNRVVLSDGVTLGGVVTIGDETRLAKGVRVGKGTWLGKAVSLGEGTILGEMVSIGAHVVLGKEVIIGDRTKLDDQIILGDRVILGNRVVLHKWVELGDGTTSEGLNAEFRETIAKTGQTRYWKWLKPDRMSPNFDGGTPLEYPVGATIERPEAVVSDQQCDVGLHVLRIGYRPEWLGLCRAGHDLICAEVEVDPEDVCFAGLPTNDAKLRVRKLKVLT